MVLIYGLSSYCQMTSFALQCADAASAAAFYHCITVDAFVVAHCSVASANAIFRQTIIFAMISVC